MNDILGWIIVLCLLLIIWYLRRLPYILQDKLLENQRFSHNKELQTDSFYRKISVDKLSSVLDQWLGFIISSEDLKDAKKSSEDLKDAKKDEEESQTNKWIKLKRETALYGSKHTVKIMANMFQYMYDDKNANETIVLIAYISLIIASLKDDFSAIKIDPIDLIKTQITDFEGHEEEYNAALKQIKKKVSD